MQTEFICDICDVDTDRIIITKRNGVKIRACQTCTDGFAWGWG